VEAAVLPILRGPGPECHFETTSCASVHIFFSVSLKYSGIGRFPKIALVLLMKDCGSLVRLCYAGSTYGGVNKNSLYSYP
jgi:hypothetical protein